MSSVESTELNAMVNGSVPHRMQVEMRAVALLSLVTRSDFSHGIVRRRAAVLGVRFDTVPFDHQNDPARVFDAGEYLNAMGAPVVCIL